MSTRKHIAKKGVNAGRWVNCTATNCRNGGQHISSDTLYATQQWFKQNGQKLNLKDCTEKDVDDFMAANPDPTLWAKPQMINLGETETEPTPEVFITEVKDAKVQSFMKSVFDKLFRKQNSNPEQSAPKPASPSAKTSAIQESEQKAGMIQRDNEGRLGVFSHDFLSNKLTVYPIGDLTDASTASKLHEADPYKNYQNGDCGVLANEIWNLNPHADKYFVFKTEDEPVEGIHQLVQLKDGTFVDSLGVWTKEEITAYWGGIYPDAVLEEWDDGQPEPPRDSTTPVSNEQLFNVLNSTINKRFRK